MREGSLYIRPDAEADVAEAYRWYERQSPGLGEAFFEELGHRYDKISAHPQLYQQAHREIRRAEPSRFPFGVFAFLRLRGFRILARNVREGPREIDLIAEDTGWVVVGEVSGRSV